MYTWKFQKPSDMNDVNNNLSKAIHQVYLDGFGLQEGWSLEGIRKALTRSTVLGLLTTDSGEISGYAFYSIPNSPLMGLYMLWEDAICLKKVAQGSLKSKEVFDRASALFPGLTFGWVGGRTQNPLVMRRYSKLGLLFPFEIAYDEGEGSLVMNYLLENINEVNEVPRLDRSNGICRGIYRGRRLGDYKVSIGGTEQLEARLSAWGFDRDKGDALIVVSKLYKPIHVPVPTAT